MNSMRPVWRDTEIAGEIVVMPLTPVATCVTRKTCAAREVQPVDVGEAVLIGDEEQVLAVGRELRIDVLPVRERREHADAARREVVRRELQRRELQRVEIRLRAAIGRERDRLAVGRPRRLDVGVAVVRELA